MSLIETLQNNFAKKPSKNDIYMCSNPNAKLNIINNRGEKVFFKATNLNSLLGEVKTRGKSSIYFFVPENYDSGFTLLDITLHGESQLQQSFFSIYIATDDGKLYFDFSNDDPVTAVNGLSSDSDYGHIITNHEDFTIELKKREIVEEPQE